MAESFYVPDGSRLIPTEWTIGPWDPGAQHAGPPAALVARAIEGLEPGNEMRVARFTFEVLKPVPLAPLHVVARVVRPGKRVQFAEAVLSAEDGGEIARASAWRIRTTENSAPATQLESPPLPGPDHAPPLTVFDPGIAKSYFSAMEWRAGRGTFSELGPAAVWMRMRHALVDGEEPSPLSRVLTAADSGNGISREVPIGEYLFINTELTVHLVRMPEGEWVCVDAVTRIDRDGVGHAQSVLWDARGRIGSGNQVLLIARR
jgi:Thioesterase-like superfamily